MQSLKQISSSFFKSPLSSIFSSHIKPLMFTPLSRPISVSTPCPIYVTPALEQKKARKLPASMYDGGENGGVDYGADIMDQHRKGPHKKVRPNRNPLGFGVPYAKGIVIKPVIKKPKKPNSANRKVIQFSFDGLLTTDISVCPGQAVHRQGADCLCTW